MTTEYDDTQEPAPTPLLFAGAAALGLSTLTGALECVSYLVTVPWGWLAAAAVAATVGLVWVLGRPEKRQLLLPMAWSWALLAGLAVFDVLWPSAPSSGETISTSEGEFIVPSSGWESFGLSLLGAGLLFWLIAMLLTLNPPIGRGGSARHEVRMLLRGGKIGLLQDPNLHHHEGHLVDETVPHPHIDFHALR